MKKVEAIIQPYKFEPVRDALLDAGFDGMTVYDVRGHGRQKGHAEWHRGHEYHVDTPPKTKIEIVVPDRDLNDLLRALATAARTGKIGDGKIFVTNITEAHRIRTGEIDEAAL